MEQELSTLLVAAAAGDESAFSAVAERYSPLISDMSARFLPSFAAVGESAAIGVQDLEQEARLALYRAVRSYNVAQSKVTFGLYAQICIRNSFISLLRRYTAREKARRRAAPPSVEVVSDPLRMVASSENSERLLERIAQVLSPLEMEIFHRYISGESVSTIASALGREAKSIHNAVYRIRCKVRALHEPPT